MIPWRFHKCNDTLKNKKPFLRVVCSPFIGHHVLCAVYSTCSRGWFVFHQRFGFLRYKMKRFTDFFGNVSTSIICVEKSFWSLAFKCAWQNERKLIWKQNTNLLTDKHKFVMIGILNIYYWLIFVNRWRPSRLASIAGTTGSSFIDGCSTLRLKMAWTRLTPPMFSHFLVRPRRRRRRSIATASCLLALVMMIGKWNSFHPPANWKTTRFVERDAVRKDDGKLEKFVLLPHFFSRVHFEFLTLPGHLWNHFRFPSWALYNKNHFVWILLKKNRFFSPPPYRLLPLGFSFLFVCTWRWTR